MRSMPPGPYLMGIDVGLTMVKAAIFDPKGRRIAMGSRKLETEHPVPNWAERDLSLVWKNTRETIREVIKKSKIRSEEIASIGVSGYGDGVHLLDKRGEPVRKSVLSLDSRAAGIVERWGKENLSERIFSITGQIPFEGYPLALLRWVKENEQDNYKRTRWIVFCKDFIKYKLTDKICTDETDPSTMLDVKKRAYSDEVFELSGIEECTRGLPEIVQGWKICDEVTSEAAKVTGLKRGTPVASGLLDAAATALGAGCLDDGQLMIVVGTWGVNEITVDKPTLDPRKSWFCRTHGAPNRWLLISPSPTSAANLEWFVKQCCGDERQEAESRHTSPYAICDEEILKIPIGSQGIIFHPFLYGLPTKPTRRSGFYGIAGWHTRPHLLRALYEGVTLCHYGSIKELARATKIVDVRIAGGGARSRSWSQMFADVVGRRIRVPRETEPGALGVAISAGIAVGLYKDHKTAIKETISIIREHKPIEENTEKYKILYEAYEKLIDTMSEAWDYMNGIAEKLK